MPALKSYNDFYEDGNAVRKSNQNQEKKKKLLKRELIILTVETKKCKK